jgi:PAS domain S-box-containing protein
LDNKPTYEELKQRIKELEEDAEDCKLVAERLQFLSLIAEQVSDAVLTTDLNFKINWANQSFKHLYGYSFQEIIGKSPDFLNAEPMSEKIQNDIYKAVSSGKTWKSEVLNRRKDGSAFPCELLIFPLVDKQGNIFAYAGHQRDITERKKAEEKLVSYQQKLRTMASELSIAENRERLRIATDLHDLIGQNLSVSQIKLGMLKEFVNNKDFLNSIEEIQKYLHETIEYTRTMTYELGPPVLYELGLEPALEWFMERIKKGNGIKISYRNDKFDKPLLEENRVFLFQAVREILTNAIQHGQAKNLKVFVNRIDNNIRIIIEDDGIGFDISNQDLSEKNKGLGLFNIRERINYLGGDFQINSKSGKGTCITLTAPLQESLDKTGGYRI